jgi:glycosyltransferase involved in cell wall biosynthesis
MTAPLVSVLMPTLNSERTIEMCLSSIRRQTLGRDDVEILIADGGSKDRTRAIAKDHGAIILENERVLPEYGLNVAMTAARGRYGIMLGSDEVITNERSFEIKVRLMEDNPHVHNVVPGGFQTPEGYPPISDYVNRFGDPFSFFMHRIDASDMWNMLRSRYRTVRVEPDYLLFQLEPSDVLPICDDGHFFSLDYLRTIADLSDLTIIPRLLNVMAREHRQLAVVKDDFMRHYSTSDYRTAKRKIEWRIIGNVHHVASGSVGYSSREDLQPSGFRMKKYFFIPYALSVVAPVVDAARMTVRYRNPAMLYHVPLTVGAGLSILKHTALKALGVKVGHGVYGK